MNIELRRTRKFCSAQKKNCGTVMPNISLACYKTEHRAILILTTQPSIWYVLEALSLVVKQPGHKAVHLPPYSAEAKNMWCCTSTPSHCSMAQYSMKHENNFAVSISINCAHKFLLISLDLSVRCFNSHSLHRWNIHCVWFKVLITVVAAM